MGKLSFSSLGADFQQGAGACRWAGLSYAFPSMLLATLNVSRGPWKNDSDHLDGGAALRDVRGRR